MKIDNKNVDNEIINYNFKFIDSYPFMNSTLDSLVNNLSEINSKRCKHCEERNKTTQYCEFINIIYWI